MESYKPPKAHQRGNDLKKRWYISYLYKHPDTNKFEQNRVWLPTKYNTLSSRLQAIIELRDVYHEKLKSGWSPYDSGQIKFIKLTEAFDKIIKFKETTSRKRTVNTYKNVYSNFKKWLTSQGLINLNIEQFTTKYAIEYFDYLKIEQGISNRTYNNNLLQLRTFYNQFNDREYTKNNPFKKVRRLPIESAKIKRFTKDELTLLSDHLSKNQPGLWIACQFIFYCFIRPGELVQLKPEHIDIENKTIIIPASISKNKLQQVVAIPDHFFESLKKYIQEIKPEDFIFSVSLEPGPKQIRSDRLSEKFTSEVKKLGININLYALKHNGAGMAIESGVNIQDLRNHLRHKDLSTTSIYISQFTNVASEDLIKKFPKMGN